MIADENQYLATQEQERKFALLVAGLETAAAPGTAGAAPWLRRAKLESAQSILCDLRRELLEWETRQAAAGKGEKPAFSVPATTVAAGD